MASDRLVLLRYATALHELASQAGVVERVELELTSLGDGATEAPELLRRLASPQVSRAEKRRVLTALLGDGAHDLVRRTLMLLCDKGRAASALQLGRVFADVAMQASDRMVARVDSAVPLDEGARGGITRQLQALTGKTVTLDTTVDADLIGGLRVILGSRMIDGSVRSRLEGMRERLLRAPLGATD